jgi:hypothetical protein
MIKRLPSAAVCATLLMAGSLHAFRVSAGQTLHFALLSLRCPTLATTQILTPGTLIVFGLDALIMGQGPKKTGV